MSMDTFLLSSDMLLFHDELCHLLKCVPHPAWTKAKSKSEINHSKSMLMKMKWWSVKVNSAKVSVDSLSIPLMTIGFTHCLIETCIALGCGCVPRHIDHLRFQASSNLVRLWGKNNHQLDQYSIYILISSPHVFRPLMTTNIYSR
jgi:hypothetical protein